MRTPSSEIEARLNSLRVIKSLRDHPGWVKLRDILKVGREARARVVVSGMRMGPDGNSCEIPESETRRLRAEINTLDWIVGIADVSDKEIDALASKLEFSREHESRLAQAGLLPTKE